MLSLLAAGYYDRESPTDSKRSTPPYEGRPRACQHARDGLHEAA